MSVFKSPKPPKVPEPEPVEETKTNTEAEKRRRARLKRGLSSTLLVDPNEQLSQLSTKTLFGVS